MTYSPVRNSTFLDFSSYQLAAPALFTALAATSDADLATVASILSQAAYATYQTASWSPSSLNVTAAPVADSGAAPVVTVALMLNRANDPTALLDSDWAHRQAALADRDAVAATYGADPAVFAGVLDVLAGISGATALGVPGSGDTGYVSSAASHTIWLSLTARAFQALFGTSLLQVSSNGFGGFEAWAGNLSLPSEIAGAVSGIWIDQAGVVPPYPAPAYGAPATLPQGVQGIGNGNADVAAPTPGEVAAAYDFPLSGLSVRTTPVALIEGSLPPNLEQSLNLYRASLGLPAYAAGQFTVISGTDATTSFDYSETTLDVSVVAGAAPGSSQLIYIYNGQTNLSGYQAAVFDDVNRPFILSSSFSDDMRFSPDSPFAAAYDGVFVDAALRNVSVFLSSGDGGSQGEYGTGLPAGRTSHAVPTAVIVGGTSPSSLASAAGDASLDAIVAGAAANDPATLFALTASGLKSLPGNMNPDVFSIFVETVWNTYQLSGNLLSPSYYDNKASTGGVYAGTPVPSYQSGFGLDPTQAGPEALTGRGVPDVSAMSGGNTKYDVLDADYGTTPQAALTLPSGGTSASTPFWAALAAQIDTLFRDQGLPHLGYFNDLLYIADAIAPGSFNDITLGDNISTYYYYAGTGTAPAYVLTDPSYVTKDGHVTYQLVPTGVGYEALPGYDQATGLGSPNGLLLARALTAIAHTQRDEAARPDVLIAAGDTTGLSGAAQTLLVQATGSLGGYDLQAGDRDLHGTGDGAALAWTSRLAQQAMQADFDPALVRLLDGARQATPDTLHVAAGAELTSAVAGVALGLYQADMTAPYGFVAFGGQAAGVTVARPVAVAETADDGGDPAAVVRLRQNGADATSLMVYKVDDLSGAIDGIAPGDPLYAAAAAARAYRFADGATSIAGPGYGNYAQAELSHVGHGDLVALALTNGASTYWAFADANETAGGGRVTHLWSYGLNTFGFEDTYGGGDRDYNDLVVQLDFTSLSGHGWIA